MSNEDRTFINIEFIKEFRDKTLYASPSKRITYEQFDKMCKDDEVLTIMSKELKKSKAKLKQFCKYFSIFKKNIHLKPEEIFNIIKAIKQQEELFESLDELCDSNKSRIIEWLVDISIEYNGIHNNKISNLLTKSKIEINTKNEYDVYNSILKWFLDNKEQFTDSDDLDLFDNIPSTTFTKISKAIMMQNIDIVEAIKKWKSYPNINPYNGNVVKTSIVPKSKYVKLYEKFITHLSKDLSFEKIRKQLPTNHIYVLKDIDYLENLQQLYTDEQDDKWIDFLIKNKDIIYSKEQILDKKGYTVYDHLFMHFCLKKSDSSQNIDKQFFLYETIENQIKLVNAIDMDCYEVIDSMLSFKSEQNKGINFEIKKISDADAEVWSYYVPPLLKLFIDYIYEIAYYLMPIQKLNLSIFHEYFLYGKKDDISNSKIKNKYIDESIKFNKHRLKTILNIILGSINSSNKTFLKILWKEIQYVISEEQKFIYNKNKLHSTKASSSQKLIHGINKKINDAEMSNFKMFFVSSLFDIETVHKESQEDKNIKYEPVIDPYNNLPEPPKIPRGPVISQELERYRKTSAIKGKDSAKEKELKEHIKKEREYKKELKEYDKNLKKYNDEHLGQKLSPYFSVKLSRAKSVINDKNSLRLNYTPLKVSAKSLIEFKSSKNKALLSKFEKEPYSRTYKKNKEEEKRQEIEIEKWREREREAETMRNAYLREDDRRERARRDPVRIRQAQEYAMQQLATTIDRERTERQSRQGGGTKKTLSKSDLKLKLALEADNPKFNKFAKKLSPSGKSPRQKYVGCDLNDNDPITQETLSDLHFKKIKYLSKIKTTLPDGKIITHCYDTIPFYNYILSCYNNGEEPENLAVGREPLTTKQKDEVFKKIRFFTKQSTLRSNINIIKKYFLKAKYISNLKTYKLEALINIGTIDFDVINYNKIDKPPPPLRRRYPSGMDPAEYELYDNYVAERRQRRARGLFNVTDSTPTSNSSSNPSSSSSNSYDLYEVEPTLLHTGPILSTDDMLFEDTSDATVILIQQGMANGYLLRLTTYPYWIPETQTDTNTSRPTNYKFLLLPPDNFRNYDEIEEIKQKTKVFNNTLTRLV